MTPATRAALRWLQAARNAPKETRDHYRSLARRVLAGPQPQQHDAAKDDR